MTDSMIEAAFDYIDTDVSARKDKVAFISLFGGEPLIDVAEHHRIIQIIGQNTIERGHKLHITTNGRQLHAFRKEVELYCASMQVTIDGALVNKDKVTLTRDGKRLTDLYETLIDISRNKNKDIMIRFLVSEETVKDFIQFSDKLFEDETSDAKLTLAVAPIQNKAGIVEESIPKHRILQKLVAALKGKWYSPKIAYMDWRSLAIFSRLRGGEKLLPSATFYHCEANVGLVSFDSSGFIYSCYEAMGNEAYAVGRFWPETSIDKHHLNQYRERNSFSMELCSSCALSPYCGGGCEVRGRKQTGSYMLPFCDDLHQEFSYILKHWRDVQPTIGGEHEPGI